MDLGRDGGLLVLLGVAFVAAMFLAAAETSLLRVSSVRVAAQASEGSRRARRLAKLIDDLPQVLSAILLSALLAQIGAATIAGLLADRWFGGIGITVASIVLTILLFVYGEAIPKTYAVRHTDRVALGLSLPVRWLELGLRPIVSALVWFADLQAPGRGVTTSPTVTEDELRLLATRAAKEGEITGHDLELIERAFRLGDRRVDDVMVPRTEIVAVSEDATVTAALAAAIDAGHRRLPVFRGSVENITGMVRLRDLVEVPEGVRSRLAAAHVADEPLYVPESKRVLDTLEEMQRQRTHLAVVVDEYGGTAGMVTLEDIAEELLGTMTEDAGEAPVIELEVGTWSLDATLPVEDLEPITGVRAPEGSWNTVGGLVIGLSGVLPDVGQEVETDGLRIRVTGVRRRRITRVVVTAKTGRSPADETDRSMR
jgi:CBS domain containing-hemolysin-like protein